MPVLKIDRGTTFALTVEYRRNGVAASLVGATVRFTMKAVEFDADMDDSDALVAKDVTNGTADGEATIVLAPADTAALAPTSADAKTNLYHYDIKVQEADGDIYKLDEGTVRLDASPTNRRS